MTSVWVAEHGWCYLNAAIDCCTREITGWALDVRCRAQEALAVVDAAVAERGLSDVLCEVGVTDAARGAGKAIHDQTEDQVQRGMSRLGPLGPRVPLRRSATGSRGCCPTDALQDALSGLAPEEITGPGGLMTQLAGRVLETALGAELTEHLGYPPGQAPPGGAGNTRNGSTPKTGARPSSGRCRSGRRGTARAASSRSWSASARRGWPAWMTGCWGSTPAA